MDEFRSCLDLRTAFHQAPDGEVWRGYIERIVAGARPSSSLGSAELLLRIESAGIAAHHAYLLRWLDPAHALISSAEACVREVRDPAWKPLAELASHTAKHRLYRNLRTGGDGDTGSFDNENQTLKNWVEHLSTDPVVVASQQFFHARLELAHAHRNVGAWKDAIDLYEALAPQACDNQMIRLVLFHYAVSLVCDFVELLVLPTEPLDPQCLATAEERGEVLQKHFTDAYRASLRPLIESLPGPEETRDFPFLHGLYHKHRALWLAWDKRLPEAQQSMETAESFLEKFKINQSEGLTKGQLLAREFRALVRARQGDLDGALSGLESALEGSRNYYRRLERRAATHLCSLRFQRGEPLRDEELELALSAFNRLDRKKVRPLVKRSGKASQGRLDPRDESDTAIEEVFTKILPDWIGRVGGALFGRTMAIASTGPDLGPMIMRTEIATDRKQSSARPSSPLRPPRASPAVDRRLSGGGVAGWRDPTVVPSPEGMVPVSRPHSPRGATEKWKLSVVRWSIASLVAAPVIGAVYALVIGPSRAVSAIGLAICIVYLLWALPRLPRGLFG